MFEEKTAAAELRVIARKMAAIGNHNYSDDSLVLMWYEGMAGLLCQLAQLIRRGELKEAGREALGMDKEVRWLIPPATWTAITDDAPRERFVDPLAIHEVLIEESRQ
jgi:hypothetical protein